MDEQKYMIGEGKQRPAYKPQAINCPNCGAGLTIKNEQSELVVCPFCSSHLDVSEDEKKVLGKGEKAKKWKFVFELGDSFKTDGQRYEIIARLVFTEDEDDPVTRDYLLYNPYRGTLWLSEYEGEYSLFKDSHVMPKGNPFTTRDGGTIKTYNDTSWRKVEDGMYSLAYVDGALPWIAKKGDQVKYAEFVNSRDRKFLYEVQRIENELEYGMGKRLTKTELAEASNKKIFKSPGKIRGVKITKTKKKQSFGQTAFFICGICLFFVIINIVLLSMLTSSGTQVMKGSYDAALLTDGVYTESFGTEEKDEVVKIDIYAPLDNAWMALNMALVKDENLVIHVDDADISYYHGYEGGESWSEGSKSHTTYWKIPEPGVYRLLLQGISNSGNTNSSDIARHKVNVKIKAGAIPATPFTNTIIAALIIAGITIGLYVMYKKNS